MLHGKTAIITGSNRGIGLSTVKVFAENGAFIWACARKQSDEFEEIIHDIARQNDVQIIPIYFDITDKETVKEAIKNIGKKTKSLDVLVNNAGISVEKLFSMTSVDVLKETVETNYLSQIHLTQLVSRYMMKAKQGSIINIASVAGMESEIGGLAYGSSKAALIFSTKTMAKEMGPYGIRVNSVSPGFIETDMWAKRDEEIKNRIMNETPLHRQGTPQEVAKVILFLATDMSSYITAQNIVVDGGRLG